MNICLIFVFYIFRLSFLLFFTLGISSLSYYAKHIKKPTTWKKSIESKKMQTFSCLACSRYYDKLKWNPYNVNLSNLSVHDNMLHYKMTSKRLQIMWSVSILTRKTQRSSIVHAVQRNFLFLFVPTQLFHQRRAFVRTMNITLILEILIERCNFFSLSNCSLLLCFYKPKVVRV